MELINSACCLALDLKSLQHTFVVQANSPCRRNIQASVIYSIQLVKCASRIVAWDFPFLKIDRLNAKNPNNAILKLCNLSLIKNPEQAYLLTVVRKQFIIGALETF